MAWPSRRALRAFVPCAFFMVTLDGLLEGLTPLLGDLR